MSVWRNRLGRFGAALPVLMFVLGLLLSAAAGAWFQRDLDVQMHVAFERKVKRVVEEVERRFAQPISGLRGAAGLYAANTEVSRTQFDAYVASREMAVEFPGVRGFGFIERVPHTELTQYIAAQRASGATQFELRTLDDGAAPGHPGAVLADHLLVKYMVAVDAGTRAIGLDAGSEPLRRRAAEQAIDSGAPALSAPVTLRNTAQGSAGFVLFLPVFRNGADPVTPAQRHAALVGLLFAPLIASEFLEGISEVEAGLIDMQLLDSTTDALTSAPVFESLRQVDQRAQRAGTPPGALAAIRRGRLEAFGTVAGPGREMTLRVRSTPLFDATYPHSTPWGIFGAGTLASAMLAALLWQQGSGRRRAEALAQRMTVDLDRLAQVVKHTSDAVCITDRSQRITWINDSFTRITGYELDEARGRIAGELLASGKADPAAVQTVVDAIAAGSGCRVELLERARDGHEYWIDLEIQPLRGAHGELTGFMEIGSEVGERHRQKAQLEAALRESEALLGALNMHAIVSVADPAGRITAVNAAFCRISGYSTDELIGQNHRVVNSGVQPAEFWVEMWGTIAGGTPWRHEVCNRAKDGTFYWVDTFIAPFRGADGRIEKFISIRTDITAAKRAQAQLEAALRDSAALLGTLNMHAIVSVADPAGRITDVNEAFCRISGYSADELIGQNHRIVNSSVQPDEFWVEMWGAIASGTPWRGEVCNRAKDGTLYWVDTFIAPFRGANGRIEKFISIRTDITASKKAASELQRDRRRLDNIIDGTNAGSWEWNLDTGEILMNERCAQIFGRTLDEPGATNIQTWHERCHPDDVGPLLEKLKQHCHGATQTYECEARTRHKDGHWVWVLARGKLFSRGENGRPEWMAGTHMDITERKRAEAELLATQELLDRTGRIAGVGGWEFDLRTKIVRWSAETCRIHDCEPGHQPTLDEALGYFSAEARDAMSTALQDDAVKGEGYDLELPMLTAKGRRVWVRAIGQPEYENARPVRLVGALQDITARRAMESELRRNNEVMSSVLENLPCGLSVVDANLNLVASNRQFRELLDFPDRLFEAPTTRFEDLVRFDAQRGEYGTQNVEATVLALLERARAPALAHRFERVRLNGVPLEVRGAPMPRGGVVTTYIDISERKRAEGELLQRERLMGLVIDSFPGVVAHWDTDLRCTIANRAYQTWTGLDPVLMVGRTPRELFGETFFARDEACMRAALRGEEQQLDRTHVADDGRTLYYQLHYVPERDGEIVRGFISVVIDLTAMKEIQLQLEVRSVQAEQASVSKSQFLANMSHEIRTPMNAILGMLSLLRKTTLTSRQADYASKTDGAARSLLGLLNDILDFSKVEAGKLTLDPHRFDVEQLLRDLSVILSAGLGGKNVEVLFDIDPALPRFLIGDALRLRQVLINLGGNAIKFTAVGEVVVSVRVLAPRELDDRIDGNTDSHAHSAAQVRLEIAVRDTGIGIAPQNQARIFSGFTQAEASTTRRFGGTGLGVVISQRLVALMGGELSLDSELGQGSRFHFCLTLPVAAAELDPGTDPDGAAGPSVTMALPAPPARVLPGTAAHAALRVLVVDDNPIARDVLRRMAIALGWDVDVADSGAAALLCMQQRGAAGTPYGAVFVDWKMPDLDGWETSRRMRDLGLVGDAAVIVIVTAHAREMLASRSDTEQALIDGFLVKPVTASMLVEALAQARAGTALPVGQPTQPPHAAHAAHAAHARRAGSGVQQRANPQATPPEALRRLAGLRLLVVEDNLNNQQVAQELLEDEGASVQLAGDGQQALDTLGSARLPFDVVLMDLQMPVMDGLTAARQIRQNPMHAHLPIIAMTANAMASDRAACLAAGMNDHVGKPFDLDHLVSVLRQHSSARATAGLRASPVPMAIPAIPSPTAGSTAPAGAVPPTVLTPAVRAAVTAAGVDLEAALARLGGKLPVYQRLLRGFVADLAAMATQLSAHAAHGETAAALRLLHTLRGVAATLGATALATSAAAAEAQLDPAAGPEARSALATLAQHWAATIDSAATALAVLLTALERAQVTATAIATATPDLAAPAGVLSDLDTLALVEALNALSVQLGHADMVATESMMSIQLRFGRVLSARLTPLDDAIAALDFKCAQRLCDGLAQDVMKGMST